MTIIEMAPVDRVIRHERKLFLVRSLAKGITMPKNKKPQGGRPAKNFEPRYGAKTSYQDRKRRPGESSSGTTGSRSPGHRGYRAAEEGSTPKRRWTAQEKVARDEARGIRSRAGNDRPSREDRPRRDDRAYDRPRRDDRAGGYREDRPRRLQANQARAHRSPRLVM